MPPVLGEYFPSKTHISWNLNKYLCRCRDKAIVDEGEPYKMSGILTRKSSETH